MNAIAFGTKRAFHAFLRFSRKHFARVGLTAARFDLMYAVYGDPRPRRRRGEDYGIFQNELPARLGVTAGVVSRMLRSLEELGLVTRKAPLCDRRQRHVKLTEAGLTCLRDAWSLLVRLLRRFVCEAICFGQHRDPEQRFVRMAELESYLDALRHDFGDTATLYYRWGHPDD
jgi:DNA-binding MarR family transcriptional regulator